MMWYGTRVRRDTTPCRFQLDWSLGTAPVTFDTLTVLSIV